MNSVPLSPSPTDLKHSLLELEKHISHGAAHDSFERGGLDAPKCHPETRTAVQEQIMSWIGFGGQEDQTPALMWLSGPAGSGKTAIAGSIADACQARGWLAGSFFFSAFSGYPDRRSKRCVIPTLAYHLIQQKTIPELKEKILFAISDTPSVFNKRLSEQMEILILRPLRSIAVGTGRHQWPKVIIIDGVDECAASAEDMAGESVSPRWSQEASQQDLISALVRAAKDPAFPFRLFIVSRPEPAIREALSTPSNAVARLFLDEKYEPDADIALYLEAKFAEIRRRFNIPMSWPSQQDLRILVQEASGQFVYAATVVRFIFAEGGTTSPQERLKTAIGWRTFGSSSPLAALDSLYLGIIRTSPNPILAAKWLITIHKMPPVYGKPWRERWFIKGLLESFPGELEYLLGNLASLVDLNPEPRSRSFDFYHKTLGDFLDDDKRSAALYAELQVPAKRFYSLAQRLVVEFIDERVYQILRNRGPQGALADSDDDSRAQFLKRFCIAFSDTISTRPLYNDADVDWWWTSLSHDSPAPEQFSQAHLREVDDLFARIHKDCRWYRCLPSCKVWRKGILKRCAASGAWILPRPDGAGKRFIMTLQGKKEYREGFLGYSSHRPYLKPANPDLVSDDGLGRDLWG